MKCSSVGFNCDFVASGQNEEEVMTKVAEHARKDHGMQTIPEEVAAKVKAAIHEA
jgi:predicted small metal-binding protein